MLVDPAKHIAAGPRQPLRGRRLGPAPTRRRGRRELADAEVHSPSSIGALTCGRTGPIRAAATTAQAVIAPTSAKVSW